MLTIISMFTDSEPYRTTVRRLEKQAVYFGLQFWAKKITATNRKAAASMKPRVCIEALDRFSEILFIDADDELIKRPGEMPVDCEVGIWKNPELKIFATHLLFASSVYCKQDECADAFLWKWNEIIMAHDTSDHRAFLMTVDLMYNCFENPNPIQNITKQLEGCIQMNPSPVGYRPTVLIS